MRCRSGKTICLRTRYVRRQRPRVTGTSKFFNTNMLLGKFFSFYWNRKQQRRTHAAHITGTLRPRACLFRRTRLASTELQVWGVDVPFYWNDIHMPRWMQNERPADRVECASGRGLQNLPNRCHTNESNATRIGGAQKTRHGVCAEPTWCRVRPMAVITRAGLGRRVIEQNSVGR